MATGLGVDPTKDSGGVITSGTSSQDMRKVWGGLYSPGIVSGCKVTTSASAMTYTISAGVAVVSMATDENVLIPVPATTITTAVGGASARTDVIYAQQQTPAVNGTSDIIIGITSGAVPAGSVELQWRNVPAGATNTNATSQVGAVNYSIPYGASLGMLYGYQYTQSGLLPNALSRYGYGTINLPTDRRVRFSLQAVLYATGASGFDNSKYCEYYFLPNFDNGDYVIWTTQGLHQAWGTYQFEIYVNLTAGTHTVNLGMGRMVGPGTANTFYGTDGSGFGRKGIYFQVEDAGPIV